MDDSITKYLSQNLNTKFIGKTVYSHNVLSSTMDEARKLVISGTIEGTVVIADRQTEGRGRLKRIWLSPQGSLSISIILKPPLEFLPALIMSSSLAVMSAIKIVTGIKSDIKWPNDVLIKGKKLCGILIENEIRANKVTYSVIGIGINIGFDPSQHPDISRLATSLSFEANRPVSREEACCVLLNEFERFYSQALAGSSLRRQWQDNMETIGKLIHIRAGNSDIAGIAEGVDEDGTLLLRTSNDTLEHISVGDVTIIKR